MNTSKVSKFRSVFTPVRHTEAWVSQEICLEINETHAPSTKNVIFGAYYFMRIIRVRENTQLIN